MFHSKFHVASQPDRIYVKKTVTAHYVLFTKVEPAMLRLGYERIRHDVLEYVKGGTTCIVREAPTGYTLSFYRANRKGVMEFVAGMLALFDATIPSITADIKGMLD